MAAGLLAGCPRSAPAPAIDYTAPPRLPSPIAGTYSSHQATPRDPVVASVVGDHRWDAYLAGAATGLALPMARGAEPPTSWEARETAWRAGWPYPLDDVVWFSGPPQSPPPDDVVAWVDALDPATDLGLVRARGALRETWVGITARPRIDLGVLPRARDLGGSLTLPAVPGARYAIADGDGALHEGALDEGASLALDSDGEWIVQVLDDEGIAAWFPVYVGVEPPTESLLPAQAEPTDDPAQHLIDLLGEVRDVYGLPPWEHDPILDAAARRLLEAPSQPLDEVLAGVGVEGHSATWACPQPPIEACVDRLVWDPAQRDVLLSEDLTWVGTATSEGSGRVRIRVVLSGE